MKRIITIGSCLLFTAALGCSPSAEDPDEQQNGSITIDTLIAEFDKAACDMSACEGWESPSTCEAATEDSGLAAIKRQVAAGRLSFDGEAARKCVESIKKIDATKCWGANASFDESAFQRDCLPSFKGLVANGGDCYSDEECAAGQCQFGENACPGKCTAFRTVGQTCGVDGAQCAAGLACDQEGKCTALIKENESCEAIDCADGLACSPEALCVKPAAPGAAGADCDAARPCLESLYCHQADQFTTGKCTARKAAGGTCQPGGSSGAAECQGRQLCVGSGYGNEGSFAGTCGAPQDVGGPCVLAGPEAWYIESGCYGALLCDPETLKCVERPKAGQPCVDLECAWDAYCNDQDQCVAQKATGATCEFDEECLSYSCSEAGTCEADIGENECAVP